MIPDPVKLADVIELRLAAMDINSWQAVQIMVQQFREMSAQAAGTVTGFRDLAEQVDDIDRTLSWHLTMTRRMCSQIGRGG